MEKTHKYPLYRAYIGISHRGTLGSGYILAYPLNHPRFLNESYSNRMALKLPFKNVMVLRYSILLADSPIPCFLKYSRMVLLG